MRAGGLGFWLSDQEGYSGKIFKLRLERLEVFSYGRMNVVESSKKREQQASKT